jgi:hypothetical protein
VTGILELFALVETGSAIGFLASWRNKVLNAKVNFFRQPNNRPSPFDKVLRGKVGRGVTKEDRLRLQLADRLVNLIRKLVQYEVFRQVVRGLALAHSPMRQALRKKGGRAW